jgi:hypothetical protein
LQGLRPNLKWINEVQFGIIPQINVQMVVVALEENPHFSNYVFQFGFNYNYN